MKLTIKQERFAQKYVECGNAAEAYRFAYSATKMANKTIIEHASRLLVQGNIRATVEKLRENSQKSFEVKKEDILRKLAEIAGLLDRPVDSAADFAKTNTRDRIAAIAEMNRMLGYNAPEKVAQTNADGKDVIVPPRMIVIRPDDTQIEVNDESI